MKATKISMPHRHTVRFEGDCIILDYEVELLNDGIVFYEMSAKVVKGASAGTKEQAQQVADWLKSQFKKVEIDQS
jgi:hypothetical protein